MRAQLARISRDKATFQEESEKLATAFNEPDYGAAKARCDDYLNPLFKSWRTGGDSDARHSASIGSFDWLMEEYKSIKKYTKLPDRTRSGYDRALEDVAGFVLKDGRRFGGLHIKSIDAKAVDKLYDKLKVGRHSPAPECTALDDRLQACVECRATQRPAIVPETNPFKGIEVEYEPKRNRAATLGELMEFVRAADDDGTPSLGTAPMLAFYRLVREEDIFGRMAWSDYRPAVVAQPRFGLAQQDRKTVKVSIPLLDVDGHNCGPR